MNKTQYTLDHLMVVESSRYVSDGDIVLVGTGLPMVASLLALNTHAPNMCYIVEAGTIAPEVIPTPVSVSDPRVMHKAVSHGSLLSVLGSVLHRGLTDVGFIGGAQIDQFANVNSTLIGDPSNPTVRLPGSGGANDIASHAKKILIIARHELRRFPKNCDYITSPGYIDGPDGRKMAGLPVPYPDIHVITDLAVMSIDKPSGRLKITKLMPGISIDQVKQNTGFNPQIDSKLGAVDPPSKHELEILINKVDPQNIYLK